MTDWSNGNPLSAEATLGGEVDEIRDAVREATLGVVRRFGRDDWLAAARAEQFPEDIWSAMAEQGLLGLGVPEELGGAGGGLVEVATAMETMSAEGMPIALYLLTAFAREAILHHGSDEQKKRFVAPTATGERKMAFAITEPNAGTNSFAIETRATRTVDGTWLLSGNKIFISGADASDHMLVVARTTPAREVADRRQGMSLFVVDTHAPGVTLQQQDIDILMGDQQFSVFFDDVELSDDELIGEAGEGFRVMFDALNPERILVSAWASGVGLYALQRAVDYARERAPFGTPIGGYQGVQHPLARAKVHLDAARLMLYTAASTFDGGGAAGYHANAAKLLASEAATNACDAAIQTYGGHAFTADHEISSLWGMARLLRVAPVNNEMILNYVGEHVLRLPKSY